MGTRIATSLIDSFTVGLFGHLTAAPGSPFSAQGFDPGQGYGQLGSEFSPTNPTLLTVSDVHTMAGGPASPGLVSSFVDAPDGSLSPIAGSPFANDGNASCWIEISHDGAYLFVVNTASQTVSSYAIAPSGSLSFLQSAATGRRPRGRSALA